MVACLTITAASHPSVPTWPPHSVLSQLRILKGIASIQQARMGGYTAVSPVSFQLGLQNFNQLSHLFKALPAQPATKSGPFYGCETTSRICPRFIVPHLFVCPEYPPNINTFTGETAASRTPFIARNSMLVLLSIETLGGLVPTPPSLQLVSKRVIKAATSMLNTAIPLLIQRQRPPFWYSANSNSELSRQSLCTPRQSTRTLPTGFLPLPTRRCPVLGIINSCFGGVAHMTELASRRDYTTCDYLRPTASPHS